MNTNNTRTNDELIGRVLHLLSKPLPSDPMGFRNDLAGLLAHQAYVLKARAGAQTKLLQERVRLRYPKDKELTDWDRKIMLDAATAELQAEYDQLTDIQKALGQRIEVIRTLLIQ